MEEKKRKALEWVEKQIKKTRQALGRAEYKPGVKPEELENLRGKLELLEWISGAVLRTEMSQPQWVSVRDRLPEKEQLVLFIPTHYQGSVDIGKLSHCGNNGGVMFDRIFTRHKTAYYAKYWMHLPEAPKEE